MQVVNVINDYYCVQIISKLGLQTKNIFPYYGTNKTEGSAFHFQQQVHNQWHIPTLQLKVTRLFPCTDLLVRVIFYMTMREGLQLHFELYGRGWIVS